MVNHRSNRNIKNSGASKEEFVSVNPLSPKSDLKAHKFGIPIDFEGSSSNLKFSMMHNQDAKNYKNNTYFQKVKISMADQKETSIQMFSNHKMMDPNVLGGGSSCEDLYHSMEESDDRKIIYHKVN